MTLEAKTQDVTFENNNFEIKVLVDGKLYGSIGYYAGLSAFECTAGKRTAATVIIIDPDVFIAIIKKLKEVTIYGMRIFQCSNCGGTPLFPNAVSIMTGPTGEKFPMICFNSLHSRS